MHAMGYSALYFPHAVQTWLNHDWLKSGQRLIDFGAQEFFADPAETRLEVGGFLHHRGVPAAKIEALLRDGFPKVVEVYAAIGVDYLSIDVDGAHGSTFFDLNTFASPPEWRNAFDFVNNEGTIEHLANPINGFHVAHDMVKVGGVVRHNFPLIGWANHGFANLTPKFYSHLVGDNAYEVLKVVATLGDPTPFEDPLFTACLGDAGGQHPVKISAPLVTNIWGELVYRKTTDRPFVLPIDHVEGPNAAAVRQRLIENYRTRRA